MGCMQHGWYCPGADHQLFLTVNSNWEKDLFVETRTKSFSTLAGGAAQAMCLLLMISMVMTVKMNVKTNAFSSRRTAGFGRLLAEGFV